MVPTPQEEDSQKKRASSLRGPLNAANICHTRYPSPSARIGTLRTAQCSSLVNELLIDMNPLGRGVTDDCNLVGLPSRQHA